MKKGVLIFLLLGIFRFQAQVEYFVHVDPLSGVHTIIDSIPGIGWIQTGPSWSTVDKVNNVYYFKGGDNLGNWFLLGMNGATGQVLTKAPVTNTMAGFINIGGVEHDDSTGKLVTYGWNPAQNKEYLLYLDKATGNVTPVGVIPGCKYIAIGESTYDQTHHRFYFVGIDTANIQRMYVVNSISGSLVAAPALSNSSGVQQIRYNSATNKLYGFIKAAQGYSLCEVDPLTAAPIANVQTYFTMQGINLFPNYSSINATTNELTFLTSNMLETVNLGTGVTLTNTPFPVGLGLGENVIELRYNNNTGLLLGLHWGSKGPTTVGLKNRQVKKPDFSVYPNPATEQITISGLSGSSRAALFLYDSKGELLRIDVIATDKDHTLMRQNLPAGLYYLVCETEGGQRSVQKFTFN